MGVLPSGPQLLSVALWPLLLSHQSGHLRGHLLSFISQPTFLKESLEGVLI